MNMLSTFIYLDMHSASVIPLTQFFMMQFAFQLEANKVVMQPDGYVVVYEYKKDL